MNIKVVKEAVGDAERGGSRPVPRKRLPSSFCSTLELCLVPLNAAKWSLVFFNGLLEIVLFPNMLYTLTQLFSWIYF